MANGEDTNEFFVPPPVPSTPSYPTTAVYSADEYGTQPQVPLPPPPVAYQQPMVNDYVTRSDALLYGKACRQHANASITPPKGGGLSKDKFSSTSGIMVIVQTRTTLWMCI